MGLQVITDAFPDHAILGEEGGVSGNTSSDYLWRAQRQHLHAMLEIHGQLSCHQPRSLTYHYLDFSEGIMPAHRQWRTHLGFSFDSSRSLCVSCSKGWTLASLLAPLAFEECTALGGLLARILYKIIYYYQERVWHQWMRVGGRAVDPLDGTTNFAHSYPCFAVSVGGATRCSCSSLLLASRFWPAKRDTKP